MGKFYKLCEGYKCSVCNYISWADYEKITEKSDCDHCGCFTLNCVGMLPICNCRNPIMVEDAIMGETCEDIYHGV